MTDELRRAQLTYAHTPGEETYTLTRTLPDGRWEPAVPLGPQGALARLEFSLRRRPRGKRLANLMGRIAEVGL